MTSDHAETRKRALLKTIVNNAYLSFSVMAISKGKEPANETSYELPWYVHRNLMYCLVADRHQIGSKNTDLKYLMILLVIPKPLNV